ncbi:MAG: DUF4912 domain-containing protein [Elainellaceae cyanobacterium]
MTQKSPPLVELTLRQLRLVASEYNVSRYSRMRKEQLIEAIKAAQDIQTAAQVATHQPLVAQEQTAQETVEAAKFDVGQVAETSFALADVDEGLADLPDGYGESRVVLLPRDPQWAYVYWDIPDSHREELRRQGGIRLALRFYDVTNIDLNVQRPHSMQQYECDELAREWYLPVPVSDRDYAVEIGYLTMDGRWLMLTRSAPVRIPPVYPSDWVEDQFLNISWDEELRGKTYANLEPPSQRASTAGPGESNELYDTVFGMAKSAEAQRVAGSLFGSMHQVPEQAVSSFVFPSGMGMVGMGMFSASGMGMTMSGAGLTMSGAGLAASMPPVRPRQFWLVADAELIVYGATEPDATVTIGGQPIKLNSDGTFRFQMSFQDGVIDYPIMAVAADGEQNRSIHMTFNRETPERRTNTKEEAVQEWLA